MKSKAVVATLIGDVVGSRGARDRAGVHERLVLALGEVNDRFDPVRDLRVTVGDEYQGCFAAVGQAVAATLALRLALAPEVEVRHGVGWGSVARLDETVEDGPGWWAAREAIEAVKREASRGAGKARRTAYAVKVGPQEPPGPAAEAVNAALLLRDELLARVDGRSMSVLRGLLSGMSQKEIAHGLGISPSAVSQRVRADSLAAVVAAHRLLEGLA